MSDRKVEVAYLAAPAGCRSEGAERLMSNAITRPLFAPPRIAAGPAGPGDPDGTLLLRSADPLGEYPATVVHSVRDWARGEPRHLLVAERGPDGAWRGCSYGEAVAAADAIGQALLDRGRDRAGRCSCCRATASATCSSRSAR
jgi:hypothetical protein